MPENLKKYIRSINNFPKKGIVFRDITTLLKDPAASKIALRHLLKLSKDLRITKVCGIEARGFIFGALLAHKLNVGFIPIRKPGKLPADTEKEVYELEYGTDAVEIHLDAISKRDRVLLHDDLLATGGTAKASANLIEKLGGKVVQISFIIELGFLNGRQKLENYDVRSLINYDSE